MVETVVGAMRANIKKIIYSSEFERALVKRRNDTELIKRIENQIEKVLEDPAVGKPLRYSLRNLRRLHVGSFVLVYELQNGELRFLDFDHHDKVYKRYW